MKEKEVDRLLSMASGLHLIVVGTGSVAFTEMIQLDPSPELLYLSTFGLFIAIILLIVVYSKSKDINRNG